jgi:hypothetical protein
MAYENCRLGAVDRHTNGWGFNVVSERDRKPLVSLSYATEAEAKEAHDLMAKVIVGAGITPHP